MLFPEWTWDVMYLAVRGICDFGTCAWMLIPSSSCLQLRTIVYVYKAIFHIVCFLSHHRLSSRCASEICHTGYFSRNWPRHRRPEPPQISHILQSSCTRTSDRLLWSYLLAQIMGSYSTINGFRNALESFNWKLGGPISTCIPYHLDRSVNVRHTSWHFKAFDFSCRMIRVACFDWVFTMFRIKGILSRITGPHIISKV